MNLCSINPFVRYSNIHPSPIHYHKNTISYDCRLFFVLKGKGTFFIDNTEYPFSENSLFVFKYETPYYYGYNIDEEVEFIIFNFDFTSEYTQIKKAVSPTFEDSYITDLIFKTDIPEEFYSPLVIDDAISLKSLITSINDLFISKSFLYRELASSILKEILIKCVQYVEESHNPSTSHLIDSILMYVRNNYAKELTNISIAKIYNYHPYYISQLIKSATGKTLHQYIIYHRIKISQELLHSSNYSIDEIALKVGFNSSSQFSTAFKSKIGISPSKYRDEHKKKGL